MRRRLPLVAALLLAVALIAAGPAQAAGRLSAAQVAAKLKQRHAYMQPGASPKPDMAALNAVAAANPSFYLVVLAKPLAGAANAKGSARLLVTALQPTDPKATVGIVQGGKLGGASLTYPQERIDKAIADTGKVAATDPTGALTGYTQAVSKPNLNPNGGGSGSGGGGRPFWEWLVLILLVVGIALVVLRMRARSNEQRRRRRGGSIWTAREFHLDRLESLAARHAVLVAETDGEDADREALDHVQTAGARLLALRRTLPALTSPRELRTVAAELDAVEWEILWVEYRLADHAPPVPIMRGFPGLCFFSHEHGLGTEAIELRKPDGTIATVYVSPENRLALERGDAPAVSLVHVGSRMVPWPTAPSWYGAYGWSSDDLPGLEYGGQQIWGIDGPEREPEPDFSSGPPADEPLVQYPAEEPSDAGTQATAAETRDGELAMPGEEATRNEEATHAWSPDTDAPFEGADDPFTPPARTAPTQPVAPAPPADEPSFEEPSYEAPPARPVPPVDEASASMAFEELDEPAPSGLIEEPADEPEASEELFPPPPVRPPAPDEEDTLDGARPPAQPESTLEWDPFTDGADETRH
ncbi:MAG: hypothetical protein ACR2JV_08755 [Gaiellales bacterium]